MPQRGSPEQNPSRIRIRNPDGTVNIHCRKCGHYICTMSFNGIRTALCHYCCETGETRPLTPQEELLNSLYTPTGTIEQSVNRQKKKFNILDLVINTFQALGFGGKTREPEINQEEVVYPTTDNESSKAVAKRKKREPIFKFKKE